jgi:putative tricarboxylic transport membrane protein
VIKAPFQYDPLGPESWPQIVSVVAGLSAVYLLIRPTDVTFDVVPKTLIRLATVVLLLIAYAGLFQPLGFIVSTALFCAAFSLLLGCGPWKAVLFGVVSGLVGYGVGVELLALNLPRGLM